jgi:hypothetical protein
MTMIAIATVVIAPDLVQGQQPLPQTPGQGQMIFSPSTKFCLKGEDGNQVCFTPQGRSGAGPKTYDGLPVDPEVFKAQQEKLQAELQKRAAEARKRLEAGQAK